MKRSPENPFGPIDGSMGDWLMKEEPVSKRIRKPAGQAEVVPANNLPESIQPTEGKVPEQPIVVKVDPGK